MLSSARNRFLSCSLFLLLVVLVLTGCAGRKEVLPAKPRGWGWVVPHPELDREVLKMLNLPEEEKEPVSETGIPRVTTDTEWDRKTSDLLDRPRVPEWVKRERFCVGKGGLVAPCSLLERLR